MPATIYQAFARHDLPLAEDALIRPDEESDWELDPERTWYIEWDERKFTIRVEELETEEEAQARQRATPQREVLVLSDQARSPNEMPPLPKAYEHAHYVWYVFTAVGFAAFLALLVFKFVTQAADARRSAAGEPSDERKA